MKGIDTAIIIIEIEEIIMIAEEKKEVQGNQDNMKIEEIRNLD